MKMNMKLLGYIGLCSVLVMGLEAEVFAETAEAGQTVSVSVPKTLLLNVEDTDISIVYEAPTVAGTKFVKNTVSPNEDISVAITSNISTAQLYAKATTVAGDPLSDYNLKLSILGVGGVFGNFVSLSETDQSIASVGSHVSGGLATSENKLRVLGGLEVASSAPSYGTYNAVITYTLKEN